MNKTLDAKNYNQDILLIWCDLKLKSFFNVFARERVLSAQ
jgi:hypothetical protein